MAVTERTWGSCGLDGTQGRAWGTLFTLNDFWIEKPWFDTGRRGWVCLQPPQLARSSGFYSRSISLADFLQTGSPWTF